MTAKASEKNHGPAGLADTAHHSIDEFCHDIRTRLAVVKEFAAIIADGLVGPVSPAQKEYLDTIIAAVHEMAHMVDDLSQQRQSLDGLAAGRPAAT